MLANRPFQYGALLRIRKRQEDLKALALAEARRRVAVACEQRTRIVEEQRRALEHAGTLAHGEFDPSEVRRYYQYERHLARLGDAKEAEIITLTKNAEQRRLELEEASKSKRIMEKLEERHTLAHLTHLRKTEQRISDETATNYAAIERKVQNAAQAKGEGDR
jgi:flagellar export protein FliJ